MFTNRLFHLLIVVCFFVTACAPQAAATPVTLRMAVADAEGRPSDPYVREFIEQVKTRSQGNITVEPIWDAAAEITPGFEEGVIKSLKEGQYDLGLAGARAFDTQGVMSFQALQAPFLITNDALAEAVAGSDIASRMLENASSAGIVGLTLWPEDLRHPFSVVPGEQILSPEDFAGLSVRATPSDLTYRMLETFGASPMMGDADYQAAESGLRQGFSLTGTPTATGNVVFFPKFQVLVANSAAFEKLSEVQQKILREAAIATQTKAIAEHPREVDAAAAWCTDGGTVVMASADQVAAFEAAAQPVFASLEQDPLNAELITAIRELKAKTDPAPGAEACEPGASSQGAVPSGGSGEWSTGMLPNGVWQVELSAEDIAQFGVLQSTAADMAGMYTWTFQDGGGKTEIHGPKLEVSCTVTLTEMGNAVRLQNVGSSNCSSDGFDEVQWRLDPDGLHFQLMGSNHGLPVELKAMYEAKPWQKVEEWSTGAPPNGVWSVELSADDFARMGVLRSVAESDWAGTFEYVFEDGKGTHRAQGKTWTLVCPFTTEVTEDFVRISFVDLGLGNYDCGAESDDVQWRLDADGLHFKLITNHGGNKQVELTAMYEAKPWHKVELWSEGLPPNGVWQVELTSDDFVGMNVMQSKANQMAGTYTWTLQDGHYILLWEDGAGQSGNCIGTYAVVDDFVRLTSTTQDCPGEVEDLQWRLDDDGLHVHLLAAKNIPFTEMKANFEAKPWQKVEAWSAGLPPNGVWQVELTVEDFVHMGVLRSVAEAEWAGTYTLTLKDGKSVGIWQGLQGQTGQCQANYEVVEDFVRFTYYTATNECLGEVDDLQWRQDEAGLHFHVLDVKNAPLKEIKAYLEAKPWQKIADS